MNTELNNKTRRRLSSPNVVSLLVLVAVVLVLGASSAQAQTSTLTSSTTDTAVAPANTADPAPIENSATFTIKNGNVTDANGTTIQVNGTITLKTRKVVDTTSTTAVPILLMDIDFSQLSGTSGSGKNVVNYVTDNNHVTQLRPLAATDTIIVSCPYFESTKDGLSARTMLITATLNFDTATGKVTSGKIDIGNNVVTSTAVGSFTP